MMAGQPGLMICIRGVSLALSLSALSRSLRFLVSPHCGGWEQFGTKHSRLVVYKMIP